MFAAQQENALPPVKHRQKQNLYNQSQGKFDSALNGKKDFIFLNSSFLSNISTGAKTESNFWLVWLSIRFEIPLMVWQLPV